MQEFTIVWVRLNQDGNTVELGDISSSQHQTLAEAEATAKDICGCNDHMLVKIYDSSMIDGRDPLELAFEYFAACHKRMLASMELLRKPIHKRKKKKSY